MRVQGYHVLTANIFALMGLRQLYFLIGGLLQRLVYLGLGLAVLLAFIGVKLILHALHENNLPFINNGQPVEVVEIGTGLSLGVIVGVLVVTVIASLVSDKGKAQNAVSAARHHAIDYLDVETDAGRREEIFADLTAEIEVIKGLPEKYRVRIRQEDDLMALFERAHAEHSRSTVVTSPGSGGAR